VAGKAIEQVVGWRGRQRKPEGGELGWREEVGVIHFPV